MGRAAERALRWFVGLSLLVGGLILLAGAIQFGTLGGPIWVIPLAGVVAAVLAILTGATEGGPRSPILPASAWIVSVLLGILWARLDSAGHAFLSGYAAIVAFGTGIGILRRQLWAWPVALASVVGFGPIVLVLVTRLPTAAVVAGFVLFLIDAVALLAIHRSYFEPREFVLAMVMSRRAAGTRLAEGGPSAAPRGDDPAGRSNPTDYEVD